MFGAGDGIRTRDIDLGKVALYQLSYSRLGETFILYRPRVCCQTPWYRPDCAFKLSSIVVCHAERIRI